MYDPKTNTWTTLPDLPLSISGGRMTKLNGKPTLIGGDTKVTVDSPVTQSDLLVSYDPDTNEWYVDGKITIPRSNFAVIPIPKYMVPACYL